MESEREILAREILDTCLRMEASGMNQGTSGNVSARYHNGILITPASRPYSSMTTKDIVFLSFDGWTEPGKRPSSEWRFHLDLYREKPEIHGVIHNHAPYSTIVSIMGIKKIPALHYMIMAAGGSSIPCAPYATYGTQELANEVIKALKNRKACLIHNHGMVSVGINLRRAHALAVEVEILAKQFVFTSLLGKMKVLSDKEIQECQEMAYEQGYDR